MADFRAGVSFTPSPVTATIFPSSFNFLTISNFSIGVALEYTFVIPILLAIASAVFFWSPVIIIVSIPAFLQLSTASVTPSLIGSTNPTNPRNVISLRSFSSNSFDSKFLLWIFLWAIAITLYPSSANWIFWLKILSLFILSFTFIYLQNSKTFSGAPFIVTTYSLFSSNTTAEYFNCDS